MNLLKYLDSFIKEEKDYKTPKPVFKIPPQERLYLSDIVKFLENSIITSTSVGTTVACNQLEAMIENPDVTIKIDIDTTFMDNIERYPSLSNVFKKTTLEKAIKKGEQQTQKVCGKIETQKFFASFFIIE